MKTLLKLAMSLVLASTAYGQNPLFFQSAFNTAMAATPTFSPTSPYTGSATTVTISDATGGAAIVYCQDTTNTCTPATSGSSVSFSSTGYIRAQATAGGYNPSAIASWQGTIVSCTIYTDNFTTTGALSGSWTVVTASGYNSVNQGSGYAQTNPPASGDKGWAIYNAGPSSGNECIQATVNYGASQLGASGLSLRTDSSGDGYLWIEQYNEVLRVAGGTGVGSITMTTPCPNTTAGDVRQFSYIASTHTFTCTNVTTATSGSGTDSTLTTGSIGMLIDQSSAVVQFSAMTGGN